MSWWHFDRPHSRPQSDEVFDPEADTQWWYFDAVLENGCRLLTFIGHGKERRELSINAVVRTPDGQRLREEVFFEKSDVRGRPDRFEMTLGEDREISFHENSGLGCYRLRMKLGRISYDLRLEPELPPYSPFGRRGEASAAFIAFTRLLARRVPLHRDRFCYIPFVPRGRLSGEIHVDGERMEASGRGYHEYGRADYDFPVTAGWMWAHVDHPDWSLFTGTFIIPGFQYRWRRNAYNAYAYVQHRGRCLLAVADRTGLMARWPRIYRRNRLAQGEESAVWGLEARFWRPGLRVKAEITAQELLEYMHLDPEPGSRLERYYCQAVAEARVEIKHRGRLVRFEAPAILETMRGAL